jgi:glycosyltransferase involved in cell wall biosynthesis
MQTKIFFDLSFIADNRVTGIERFALEIYRELEKQWPGQVIALLPKGGGALFPGGRSIELAFESKALNQMFGVPLVLIGSGPATVVFPSFAPSPLCALLSRKSMVRVVHDTVFWDRAQTLSLKAKVYLKPLEHWWMKRYRAVTTVSHYSKSRIIRHFPYLKNHISVVPNAVSPSLTHNVEVPPFQKFLLSVGTIEPRKNFEFLIRVFEILAVSDQTLQLVICGRPGWGFDSLIAAKDASHFSNRVHVLTSVTDAQLSGYYSHCCTFVFPSLEEGFGIPLIEAMFHGKAVVAANNSAITEIVEGAGLLVDGYVEEEWAEQIARSVARGEAAGVVAAATQRSRRYSWRLSAQEMKKVIENVAE